MIAKLLEKGLHTSEEILEHLKQNSANPESTDKIKISKDGINAKETYYNHTLNNMTFKLGMLMMCYFFIHRLKFLIVLFAIFFDSHSISHR